MRAFVNTYGRVVAPERHKVFLVHGAGMDQSVWLLQGRWLAFHGWNAFAVDLPGHGRARDSEALPTIEAMADWLGEIIAETAGSPCWLIGHSMGALVALDLASRNPDLVAGLCLLGAAAALPVHPSLQDLADRSDPKTVEVMLDWAFGPRGVVGGNVNPGGWLQGTARNLLLRGRPEVLANDLRACGLYGEGDARARTVAAPSLVLAGSLDRMVAARASKALSETIPNGRFSLVDGAGHMLMQETPDEVRDALAGFMPFDL